MDGSQPNAYGDYCISNSDLFLLGALTNNSKDNQEQLFTETATNQYILPTDTVWTAMTTQWVMNSEGVLRLNRIAGNGSKKLSGPLPVELSESQNDLVLDYDDSGGALTVAQEMKLIGHLQDLNKGWC